MNRAMTPLSTELSPPSPPVPSAAPYVYPGDELDLFEQAHRWKSYWSAYIEPQITGAVLEVGAGTGNNVRLLTALGRHTSWTCLEPDPALLGVLKDRVRTWGLPGRIEPFLGTLEQLPGDRRFDTILYIDVLEHIEDDGAELARAAALLAPGGKLIVLAPAHQALFSPFDHAVGHYRRYSARRLKALNAPNLRLRSVTFLDAVGLFASSANKLLLKSAMPSRRQVHFWDSKMVPLSRWIDPLFRHTIGKSVVAVWEAAG
jgi:SAM-dependent methyltransferase